MPLKTSNSRPITVCGSVNIDIVAYSDTLPKPGETISATRSITGLGGKGANQACAIARLGAKVLFAGQTGADAFSQTARAKLTEFGVDITHLNERSALSTGIALIGIDAKGENTITVAGGANMAITIGDIDVAAPAIENASVLLLQLEIPLDAVRAAASRARNAGVPVILDPAPVPKAGLDNEYFELANYMTPNETETYSLVGIRPVDEHTAREAALRMHAKGLETAIIKLGAHGVLYSRSNHFGFVRPFSVKAIDSVAAGDCFNGGLAVALSQNMPLPDAVRFAAGCGALATTKHGAADAAPTLKELTALLQEQSA